MGDNDRMEPDVIDMGEVYDLYSRFLAAQMLQDAKASPSSQIKKEAKVKRYSVKKHLSVFYIEDQGWLGSDCPKGVFPKPAIELRFTNLSRAETVCDLLNKEWEEFLANPN